MLGILSTNDKRKDHVVDFLQSLDRCFYVWVQSYKRSGSIKMSLFLKTIIYVTGHKPDDKTFRNQSLVCLVNETLVETKTLFWSSEDYRPSWCFWNHLRFPSSNAADCITKSGHDLVSIKTAIRIVFTLTFHLSACATFETRCREISTAPSRANRSELLEVCTSYEGSFSHLKLILMIAVRSID